MTSLRVVLYALLLGSITQLTGCPGKSTQSNTPAHDAAYYNAHPQERQATLARCDALDKATMAADEDCTAALYSSLYGPSQLKSPASPR
jgi:hypothetical protein